MQCMDTDIWMILTPYDMSKIVKLADKTDGTLYPVTVLDAVKDGKGLHLTQILSDMKQNGTLPVAEDGFFVTDAEGNIGMKYDGGGLDAAAVSENLNGLVYEHVKGMQGSAQTGLSGMTFTPLDVWQFSKNATSGFSEVTLPHSCNAADGQSASYYRGDTYYKRTVEAAGTGLKRFFLLFKSASQQSAVTVNGMDVSSHKGGYTPFLTDITDAITDGENEILVRCNNRMDLDLAPVSSDFNKNNGLVDNVYLITAGLVHSDVGTYGVDRMHVTQSNVSSAGADIKIQARAYNGSAEDVMLKAYLHLRDASGQVVHSHQEDVYCPVEGVADIAHEFTLPDPHLWNGKDDPYLYKAEVILCAGAVVLDRMTASVGLRFYEMTATGFMLNGQAYPLRGISYHQDKAGKASAVTDADIDGDFEIIKELGCNFLRIAHYPHNTHTFDKCDELGIIVQTEIPWVNECGVNTTSSYLENLKSQMREMITNHYNHASIVFWGMSNELGNTHAGNPQGALDKAKVVEFSNALYALGKSLDTTRYVGFVTDKQAGATSYYGGVINADWLGRNAYCGWYVNQDNPAAISGIMGSEKNSFPYVALSEYGAGCNPDCHSETPGTTTNKGSGGARHDEEWANHVHEVYLQKIYGSMTYLQFTSGWILFDFAVAARKEGYYNTSDGVTVTTDPGKYYLNDKGLVTRDRTLKKDVFYLYKAKWSAAPLVHITSRRFAVRPGGNIAIKVYSNASILELYQNGTLIETLDGSGEESGVVWTFTTVPIANATDTFKVIGRDASGGVWAVDEAQFSKV